MFRNYLIEYIYISVKEALLRMLSEAYKHVKIVASSKPHLIAEIGGFGIKRRFKYASNAVHKYLETIEKKLVSKIPEKSKFAILSTRQAQSSSREFIE